MLERIREALESIDYSLEPFKDTDYWQIIDRNGTPTEWLINNQSIQPTQRAEGVLFNGSTNGSAWFNLNNAEIEVKGGTVTILFSAGGFVSFYNHFKS